MTTGAKYASATLNAPNSMGPPCAASKPLHMVTRRSRSLRTAGLSRKARAPTSGRWASMFIGQALRRPVKPLCISAQMLRARARAVRSAGQSCFSGNCSATYSAIARVSQTVRSPSTSTGTLPTGETASMVLRKPLPGAKLSKRTMTSSKSMPAWRSSTQGRMDHEE